MAKYFYLLVATILVSCAVYPAIAATSSGLPPGYLQSPGYPQSLGYPQAPGYPQAKETIIVYVPLPQKAPITAPTPTPKPTLPPSGSLTINISPSMATVVIDGKPPIQVGGNEHTTRLQTGIHTIQVTATGYLPKTERIQINNGDASYLSISLDKGPDYVEPVTLASLEVTSYPTGASVYVDGRPNGTTPCTITASVGPHTVMLRLVGYQDRTETMDLYKASRRSPQKVFWILTEGGTSAAPVQKEAVRETPSPSPSTTITRAGAQSDEPTDVLQYVIYFFRGLFGGKQ